MSADINKWLNDYLATTENLGCFFNTHEYNIS